MLCNAVLVIGKTQSVWRVNAGSISTYGRIEDSVATPDIDDLPTLEAIGDQFLELYAWPTESYTVELISDAPDVELGLTVTLEDQPNVQVVEKAFTLDSTGRFTSLPILSTPLQELLKRKKTFMDRMIQAVGGTFGTTARAISLGSGVDTGKVNTRKLESWSWSTHEDLDNPWDPDTEDFDGGTFGHPYEFEEPARLYEWVINCRVEDDDGEPLTVGNTIFELYLNDAPMSPPFFIVLGPSDTQGRQFIYGPAFVSKGHMMRPVNLENGGHEQGTIQLLGADPI